MGSRRSFWIILVVCLTMFMTRLDIYIVNFSLPTISRYFDLSTSRGSQILLSYLLVLTSTLLIFGKLEDRVSVKKIFLLGNLIFLSASLLCGLSSGINMLIAARALQGVGGAMLITSAFTVLSRFVPSDLQSRAFGWFATAVALGITLGSPLGGLISGLLSWRWIFLINIPVGLFIILIARQILPEETREKAELKGGGFDPAGGILSFFGILFLVYGLNMGQELGWKSPVIIAAFLLAVVLLGLFLRLEKRQKDPLLNFSLFHNRQFLRCLFFGSLVFIVVSGNTILFPFYLELVKGLKPQVAGLVFMIFSVLFAIISPFAGRAAEKISALWFITAALFFGQLSYLVFCLTLSAAGLFWVVLFLVIFALMAGFFLPVNNNQVMCAVPAGVKGSASGLYNVFTNLSVLLGICVFETIFSHFVPHGAGSIFQLKLPQAVLITGFRNAYWVGFLILLAGFLLSLNLLLRKAHCVGAKKHTPGMLD